MVQSLERTVAGAMASLATSRQAFAIMASSSGVDNSRDPRAAKICLSTLKRGRVPKTLSESDCIHPSSSHTSCAGAMPARAARCTIASQNVLAVSARVIGKLAGLPTRSPGAWRRVRPRSAMATT